LYCNCYAYIHGNEVGGTNPALLQAMGYGNCVLGLDVIYNREVIEDNGLLYSKNASDLKAKLDYTLENPEKVKEFGELAAKRIKSEYTWDKITREYEALLAEIIKK
jgi:glycosyltransferase involved in cell wall biosynthesis